MPHRSSDSRRPSRRTYPVPSTTRNRPSRVTESKTTGVQFLYDCRDPNDRTRLCAWPSDSPPVAFADR